MLFFLSLIITTLNVLIVGIYNPKQETDRMPFIVGSLIGLLIVLIFSVGMLIGGISLLRDKKGMYIKFLRN